MRLVLCTCLLRGTLTHSCGSFVASEVMKDPSLGQLSRLCVTRRLASSISIPPLLNVTL